MDYKSKNALLQWLPYNVPLLFSLISSIIVMVLTFNARLSSHCSIGTPWDENQSKFLLQVFHPVVLDEIVFLSKNSSDCIAKLHTEVGSAYIVATLCSLLVALLSFLLSDFRYPKYNEIFRQQYINQLKDYAKGTLALFCFVYFETRYINIIEVFRRKQLGFDGVYTNISFYWLNILVLNWLYLWLCFGAMLTIAWLWRLLQVGNK